MLYNQGEAAVFSVDQVIADNYPELNNSRLFAPVLKPILRRLLHEQAFIDFAERYPHLKGIEFVEQVLDYFHFTFEVSEDERENIPAAGKVVVIANHPIGSLDGLALLKLMYHVRPDVKIVANDLLMAIEPLKALLLPIRNMTGTSQKLQIQRINTALDQDAAIIFFPSGEVSRLSLKGIKDGTWQQGFLKLAERAKAPILPIHIEGRNSTSFYLASLVAKPLSTIMLVGQMFRQRDKQVKMTVGSIIPFRSYNSITIDRKEKIKLFKKHLYRLNTSGLALFETEAAIAPPEQRADLAKAIGKGEQLGATPDGKSIFLYETMESPALLRELGRLRETTFRAVGEGTGKRRDIDHFDDYYQHLLLWDEEAQEIAGAYRFVDTAKVLEQKGTAGLYSGSLFNLDRQKCYFLKNSLELGEVFVQQKYWGKRSLDYLWYGIGAFSGKKSHYRYLFGPVSISNMMPQLAKELLIYFYKLYFSNPKFMNCSRNPFRFSQPLATLEAAFSGTDYRADFKKLKSQLSNLGTAVPTLYKQYTELCEPGSGGVTFLDFNIDPDFSDCVDGLVIVDTHKLKEKKENDIWKARS